jgi:hypothetical protein
MRFRLTNHLLNNNEYVLLILSGQPLFQNLEAIDIASMKSHSLMLTRSIANTGKCEVLIQKSARHESHRVYKRIYPIVTLFGRHQTPSQYFAKASWLEVFTLSAPKYSTSI